MVLIIQETIVHMLNLIPFHFALVAYVLKHCSGGRECTFFLVIDQFSSQCQHILSELRSHPQSLFLFLKTTIDVHLSGNLSFPVLETVQGSNGSFGKIRDTPNDLEEYAKRLSSFPKLLHHNPIHVTDELTELYLVVRF